MRPISVTVIAALFATTFTLAPALAQPVDPNADDQQQDYQRQQQQYDDAQSQYQDQRDDYQAHREAYQRERRRFEHERAAYDAQYGPGAFDSYYLEHPRAYDRLYGPGAYDRDFGQDRDDQ